MRLYWLTASLCLLCLVNSNSLAEESERDSEAGITFFETRIRPLLVQHCYECHSQEAGVAEGELALDSRAAMRRGGSRGAAVVPGEPDKSWLLKSVKHTDPDLRMPPKREQLPKQTIADLQRWIEMGAPDPRAHNADANGAGKKSTWKTADRNFWSYQPPKLSHLPEVTRTDWPRQPLDHYVLAKLEQQGLTPAADAPPHELLRRLHFDLIGLPPAPSELADFQERSESAGLEQALSGEVDRLLALPHFGERWGRHWLDVARFAESSGTEANLSFPYAWRYRDYVLDCVNEDVPYDRFLVEQIAGDQLTYRDASERARLLIATGFLAVGPKNLDAVDEQQFHADVVDEQIDTLTRAVLANSVACARCHHHKFDPFTMEDYYALAGIFWSTKTCFGTSVSPSNRIGGVPLRLPEEAGQPVLHPGISAQKLRELQEELASLNAEKADMDKALRMILLGQKPERTYNLQDALRVFWRTGNVTGQLQKVSDTGAPLPLAMGVLDRNQTGPARLLDRGDVDKPKQVIPRGVPKSLQFESPIEIADDRSGRLELARWLTDPRHPLTSRVMVNRIWQHLFGTGLVSTVDNFGATGEPPSHPELLDRLALQFIEKQWSLKGMIREIVLSRTYRQSSQFREDMFLRDPENRWLWRMSKRRLEAECIRDAMLAVSGELDRERPLGSLVGRVIGDRPISLIGLDKRLPADLDGSLQRSVYLPIIRDRLPEVLDLFDFAEPSLVTGTRETTNVPIQALYLLNSPFVQARSVGLARRLQKTDPAVESQVDLAYRLCFSRDPEPEERDRALRFLQQEDNTNLDLTSGETPSRSSESDVSLRLITFCQALYCSGEFRNLD